MAKQADYKPFPAVVCQYLRNLRVARAEAIEQRRRAFKQRDRLRYEISKIGESDPGRVAKEAECHRCEERIRTLLVSIAWIEDEKDRAIENADQPKLWTSADVEIPAEVLAPKAPKAEGEEDEAESDEEDPDQATFDARPVGEAGTPAPVKSDAPPPTEKRKRGRPRKNAEAKA